MNLKKLFIKAFIAIAIVIFILSCNKASERIKIGVVLELTGASSVHGQDALAAIQMALEKVNNNGSINGKKIEIVVEDNASQPSQTVEAVEKLINVNKVLIIIGPITSAGTLAGAPIADKNKTILFSPTAASPKIFGISPYCYRIGLMTVPQGGKMADYCFNDVGIKNMGILAMNDETGTAYADDFQKSFEKLGGKIVLRLEYNKTDIDFRTLLTNLKKSKIDYLYVTAVPRTMGYIIRQSTELSYKPHFYANAGIEGEDLITIAGSAADGIIFTGLSPDTSFINKFIQKTNRQPSICAPQSYDAFNIVINAIKEKGPDKEGIKEYFKDMPTYKGIGGEISFDTDGEVVREAHLKNIRNGIFISLSKNNK